jgi:hypothetical protein
LVHRSTLKTARTLLDRFFRDAEGRTNHQLDVGFTLADLGLSREKAEPGLDYLVSRGLLNTFGPEIAFLTEEGVRASAEDVDIAKLGPTRSFDAALDEPDTIEAAPSSAAAVPQLVHVRLDGATSVVPLGARCSIGRAPENDIPIDDKRASKRHAAVRYERGGYVLEDLQSANGTLLNGAYCVEPTRLASEDEIVIGRTMLVFQAPPAFPPPPGAEASLPPEPSFPVSGGPTDRPGRVAPELAEPGIKVVRGRPEPSGPSSSPSLLFEPEVGSSDDVFGGEVAGERLGPGPLGLGPEAVGSTPAEDRPGPLEADLSPLDEAERLPDLGPPLDLPREPSPDSTPPSGHDAFTEEASSRSPARASSELHPTLLRDEGGRPGPGTPDEEPVLELSDVVEEPGGESTLEITSPAGALPDAPADDAQTLTLHMDLGAEALPVAREAAAGPTGRRVDLTDHATADDARLPPFLDALARLRAEVVAVADAEKSPLLEAIDVLARHPLVRAFAEDDDRNP